MSPPTGPLDRDAQAAAVPGVGPATQQAPGSWFDALMALPAPHPPLLPPPAGAPRPLWQGAAVLLLAYAVVAWLSIALSRQSGPLANVWYANAVAVAWTAQQPPRRWWALLLAVAAGMALANGLWGDHSAKVLAFIPPNLAEVAAGAWLLRRARLAQSPLRSPLALLRLLLLGGVLPALLGASVAAGGAQALHAGRPGWLWLSWLESAVIGAVSTLPLAVLIAGQPWSAVRAALDDRRLAVLLPLAVAVALLSLAHLPFAFAYLYLPLVAAALLLDMAAVALVTLAVSVTMALALATGVFVPPPFTAEWQQGFLYLAFAAVLVPALLLGAAMAEMRDHQAHLRLRKQELKRANEGLQQFVHLASHDLREPLNAVAQFSALVAHDHAQRLPPEARDWLDLVQREAQHMRELLDDVLQYAQVQQIRLPEPAAVPLDEVALDARLALARDIRDTGAQLQVEALPVVRGHRPLLRLMLEHLLSNALKFMPPGRQPQVVVQAEQREGWAIVTVSDNGIGIAEADLPRLFRPFQRLHLRREFEGTGLGLATCLQVVRAHGGDILVRSVPGQGTRMQVWLPLAQAAGSASVA